MDQPASWTVGALTAAAVGRPHQALLDSGADDHFVPVDFVTPHPPVAGGGGPAFYGVNGERIEDGGSCLLVMNIGSRKRMQIVLRCRIGDVNRVAISAGRLMRDGFLINPACMAVLHNSQEADFHLVRNSWEIRAELVEEIDDQRLAPLLRDARDRPVVAPTNSAPLMGDARRAHGARQPAAPIPEDSDEDGPPALVPSVHEDSDVELGPEESDSDDEVPVVQMMRGAGEGAYSAGSRDGPEVPAPAVPAAEPEVVIAPPRQDLGPSSSVDLMRQRLKELGMAIYGTKSQLWARILEGEQMRRTQQLEREHLEQRREEVGASRGMTARVIPAAGAKPDDETVRRHNLTHLPAASWCEWCQMGRGKDNPHRSQDAMERDRRLPVVSIDFCFLCAEDGPQEVIPEGDPGIDKGTTLVAIDADTGMMRAIPTPSKTPSEYLVKNTEAFVKSLFLGRFSSPQRQRTGDSLVGGEGEEGDARAGRRGGDPALQLPEQRICGRRHQ